MRKQDKILKYIYDIQHFVEAQDALKTAMGSFLTRPEDEQDAFIAATPDFDGLIASWMGAHGTIANIKTIMRSEFDLIASIL